MDTWPLLIGTALASFALSWAACEVMMRTGVVDAPDGVRKLQAQPVPRLGGLGMFSAFLAVVFLAGVFHDMAPGALDGDWLPGKVPAVWVALATALALASIGAVDDIYGMGALTKLLLVLAVCIAAPLFGVAAPGLETPFGTVDAPAILIAGSALWLLVFSNSANFMDGSNGLSMGSIAIMLIGLIAALMLGPGTGPNPGLVAAVAAIAAFLFHNMRGKLYAGDAGAFGMGGLFALFGLISGLPVWTVATLGLPFLADTLLTLVSRSRRRQPLLKAHRDHAYQVLLKAGWSHAEVAVAWWALSATCAIAASVGVAGGGALPFILFWLLAAALAILWRAIHRTHRL